MFKSGRANPPEPTQRVVHLDIDDTALETVGRWPWPRRVLADAITALDRMGARVIALDLLLVDPQDPEYLADGSLVEHDRILAGALAGCRAKTVIAASTDDANTRLSRIWHTPDGRRKWERIKALLAEDISLTTDAVIREAGLVGERAARVRGRFGAVKVIVVREAAQRLRAQGEPVTEEALRAALLPPGKNASLKHFPALEIIREVLRFTEAIDRIEARLPDAVAGHAYGSVAGILPPQPVFADAVTRVGIVNSVQDADGGLRHARLRWARHGKVYPQFAIAAAAAYLDAPLESLAAPALALGRATFPAETTLLSWPRIDLDRPVTGFAPHISLGRVIDLLEAERSLDERRREFAEQTRLVAEDWFGEGAGAAYDDPETRPKLLEALAEEVELQLQGLPDDVDVDTLEDLDARGKRIIQGMRRWRNLNREVALATQVVTYAQRELHDAVADKLVFVGWYATGNFGDFYPTAAHERTPGVLAHGILANSVLTGYVVREAPRRLGALVTFVLGVAVALLTSRTEPRTGFLLTLLVAVLFVTADLLLVFDRWHVWLATTTPLVGLFTAWAGTVAMSAVRALREKAQLRKQFGARVSKQLFDFLLQHPDQVHLEGQEREVTCFFSDLAGFTAISERLDSRSTVQLLNQYMYAMNEELTKLNAYVNKFLGDGIMAVWGAFAMDGQHADRAARSALACVRRLDELNASPRFEGLPKLSMRVGIATGVVTVGDCGAPPDLRDYTVIGDSANLAARLESANKQFGTRILVNGRCRELLSADVLTRPLGRITVVGQSVPTEIHEVLAQRSDATPEQLDLVERTARAVRLFQERKLAEARDAWTDLGAAHGESKLAQLYLAEIELHLQHAEKPFEGVLQLTSK